MSGEELYPYEFYVLWKVECIKSEEKEKIFYFIDDGSDPDFYCQVCHSEFNHIPIRSLDHKTTLVGRLYTKDLVELAKKNPKGWR